MELAANLRRVGNDIVACYLVADGTGVTLVDAGLAGQWDEFLAELRTRVTRLCAGSLRCEIAIHDDETAPMVPVDVRVHILRIVQEGVRNAVRHARAQVVRVEIERGARIVIRVSDDGEGIPDDALSTSRGGLSNIAKRARILGGEASWSRNGGTELVVTLPLAA